jgi:diketogulonate reductase-like aldo/keto reductase
VENGVTLGGVRLIGTSKFTSEILEKSDLWLDLTIRRCAKQREVHRYHEHGPLVQFLRGRGIVAIGDRAP